MSHAVGVDVGGTFTDFVAIGEDGRLVVHKQLTTPAEPSVAVLEGLSEMASEVEPSAIVNVIHGTTLVANSLIERRGAKTALITTRGFRDVLEIGGESRYDLYDLDLERPEPLIPRLLRFEATERILADGTIEIPLDEAALRETVREIQALEVEAVAVVLLHAYENSAHERRVAEVVAELAPEIDVSISSEVAPEWGEYERSSTTAANAFVRPLVRRYLARLDAGLTDLGAGDRLYVLLSHGGVTSADVAGDVAVQLVESGPAAGVVAACYFGSRLGFDDLISFDMGGTTAKVSMVTGGLPLQSPDFEVARVARFKRGSGLPLRVPTIELVEIGAGGGSIGSVDSLGLLKVGPRSAGAVPGPACYGRGGTAATVTDANLFLGRLDPGYFLGGEMALDPALAEQALAQTGAPAGLDADGCARGMLEIINQQMALALRTHVVERGCDPRAFTLVGFGGAGPVHVCDVARLLGIRHIVCPPVAGVASALGLLVSPFGVDLVRTHAGRLRKLDWDGVSARYSEMEEQARSLLRRSGAEVSRIEFERTVDMRYAGQGFTVPVVVPGKTLDAGIVNALERTFHERYAERFGSHLSGVAEPEALHWRLAAKIPRVQTRIRFMTAAGDDGSLKGVREAFFPEVGERVQSAVYDRYKLSPGTKLDGPALIEERESTIVIGPSASFEADDLGNVVITLRNEGR